MSRRLLSTEARINSRIGQAVKNYNLIEAGDKILVAVSGGKDSLTLLHLLAKIRTWAPVHFDLVAIHIRTDFQCGGCVHENYLSTLFEKLGIPHLFKHIKVLDEHKKTNCFWCAWNRRKTLFTTAQELGCNKLAFGHHKDDIAETVLMNLVFNGNISTMNPRQELFKGKLVLIRPLCYVEESMIAHYARQSGFQTAMCRCPFSSDSKRKYIKQFIDQTQTSTEGINIRTNIFKSVTRIRKDYIDVREEKDPESIDREMFGRQETVDSQAG